MDLMYVGVICGVISLIVVGFLVRNVLAQDEGSKRIREVSAAIKEGAMAFLKREYQILAIVAVVLAIVFGVVLGTQAHNVLDDAIGAANVSSIGVGWRVAVAILFGAACSMGAGFAGMSMAIRSNGRTAAAAQKSLNQGLRVSFRSGAVMGLTVVGIGILGLCILYFGYYIGCGIYPEEFILIIPAFGTGASAVALFSRVGGGIFTKAADAGADLAGKVEKGIPEDDPRNAAVIADFVGDNVGDVAGMGADLFESYVESIIATMTLFSVAAIVGLSGDYALDAWTLPILIASGGIVASLIGVFMVRVGEKPEMSALLNALRRGTWSASILAAIFSFLIVYFLLPDHNLAPFWAILAGLIAGVLIGESTNYFTSYVYRPTLAMAESCETGASTNVIRGFANGLLSVVPPFIFVVIAIVVAYYFSGMYGIALAGVGMLSTLGISLATDAYGPVADNAGGIVEMSHLPPKIRERTDALDSLGNTTAATGKGFAIGAAALTAMALLLSYSVSAGIVAIDSGGHMSLSQGMDPLTFSLLNPVVIAGLLIGVMLPAVFCSMTLNAVGKNTERMIEEVRRQFREIKGLMEGTARPEYAKCVDISTKGALKEMIAPSVMTICVPIIVGFVLGKEALAGFLIGAIGSGFLLAVALANAGGSWDNAKKWIEAGHHGGKGSEAHKAGVTGDAVGDPMKDTSGPSLNIMIKLMSVIALLLAPVFGSGLIHIGF